MIKTKITGGKKVADMFAKFATDGVTEMATITKVNALEMQTNAKTKAPVNKDPKVTGGDLRQSIQLKEDTPLKYTVFTNIPYAPFMEFGTGAKVSIPKGWESMASQFKGAGKRKVNIPAQPFMHPAFKFQSAQYIKDLREALKRLKDKYNG